jgi:cobalt/nickel transport system ATP-binding protein
MNQVRLRMPQIAELIYRLKHEDHLPFEKIPLTIGEARREMIALYDGVEGNPPLSDHPAGRKR